MSLSTAIILILLVIIGWLVNFVNELQNDNTRLKKSVTKILEYYKGRCECVLWKEQFDDGGEWESCIKRLDDMRKKAAEEFNLIIKGKPSIQQGVIEIVKDDQS